MYLVHIFKLDILMKQESSLMRSEARTRFVGLR
uniref:Uncharacterized protein n=1 Tax=Rhizophora mucronata TaxID=61149 RepID=A0A2P2QE57_RHIMU